mgnify:CR=1 FL=1
MKVNEYQKLAMTTLNPELNKKDVLINSVMGLCGESGEAATALEVPLEDIFQANIDKLKKRYPDGFQTEKSLVRLRGDI